MAAILVLLQALLFKSVLEESLKSMSKADRLKYNRGKSVRNILRSCRRGPQDDAQKEAMEYYDSVMANVEEKVKTRLAEISESNSDCFIEVLRLSGFPEVILCRSNVYQTIMFAYTHIKIMSDHLQTIRLDSRELLSQLEVYSKLLAAFSPSIILEILKELGKTENELATDINVVCKTRFYSFHDIFTILMQLNSVEFLRIQAFAILHAAFVETDASNWSETLFGIMKECVCSILGNPKLGDLMKIEFIMEFVPKLVKLLEETSFWKESQVFFVENFRVMYDNIYLFSQPGFLLSADYTKVFAKFPNSGFPSTLQELPAFLNSKLFEKYTKLR